MADLKDLARRLQDDFGSEWKEGLAQEGIDESEFYDGCARVLNQLYINGHVVLKAVLDDQAS